ncbi:MAG TPA: enoyl-CoA hydratase/isomerase family protein [Dongiaceae bacterium]|nr:enoyl-CoA hydratase/isomerase family protein [Dongiaceae bacterium]
MSYENILYAVEDRVATITFNRPKQHNAFSGGLIDDIVGAIAEADRDPEVRVIVITGAGGAAFSAGYDMKESAAQQDHSLAAERERTQADLRFVLAPWDCSKPVIAMIDGYCFAGALEFAMFCDVRYCSDASTFGSLEARFASAVTPIMPWLVGQRARVLVYTGDRFDSAEAYRLGVVDKVFPKAALQAEVTKIAKRMSRVALDFLKLNKRAINHTFEAMAFRNSLQHGAELAAVMLAQGSPEGNTFNAIRKKDGLAAALRWRDEQFAPFE